MRIELAEVETAIGEHPSVEIAAAAAEEHGGETILCTYVVPAGGAAVSERELRSFLRGKLPLAMIPAEFLFVDALPLSANGKIDRKRLQRVTPAGIGRHVAADDPEQSASGVGEGSAPAVARLSDMSPADTIERQVAATWTEALGHDRFGRNDDFFDCGGDSLSAVDLFIRMERHFGRSVGFDALLRGFTVAAIAEALRTEALAPERGQQQLASRREVAPGLVCRIADLDDLPGIWQVCARAFPGYADATLAEFAELCRHRWLNNPARTGMSRSGGCSKGRTGGSLGFTASCRSVFGSGIAASRRFRQPPGRPTRVTARPDWRCCPNT